MEIVFELHQTGSTGERRRLYMGREGEANTKTIGMAQVNLDCLRKLRGKHVNVFVYSYGKKICNKASHTKFSAKLLIPEKRDRANAVSVMELVEEL